MAHNLYLKPTVSVLRNMDSDVKDIFEVEREPASSGAQQLSKEAIMGSLKVRPVDQPQAEQGKVVTSYTGKDI